MLNTFKDPETVSGKNREFAVSQLGKAELYLDVLAKEYFDKSYPVSLAID